MFFTCSFSILDFFSHTPYNSHLLSISLQLTFCMKIETEVKGQKILSSWWHKKLHLLSRKLWPRLHIPSHLFVKQYSLVTFMFFATWNAFWILAVEGSGNTRSNKYLPVLVHGFCSSWCPCVCQAAEVCALSGN